MSMIADRKSYTFSDFSLKITNLIFLSNRKMRTIPA